VLGNMLRISGCRHLQILPRTQMEFDPEVTGWQFASPSVRRPDARDKAAGPG
jgi:hypothetical protein